jgi:predicted ATP-dependent endonuclease of OLD family
VKLVKFRVRNYKSIKDSGDCYFSEGYTILAGKNESGKTSLLEALEDLDKDREIRDDATPIEGNVSPVIYITIRFTYSEVNSLFEDVEEIKLDNEELEITIYKYGSNYWLTQETTTVLGLSDVFTAINKKLKDELKKLGYKDFPKKDTINYDNLAKSVESFLSSQPSDNQEIITSIREQLSAGNRYTEIARELEDRIVSDYLPRFSLYSTFSDRFPDSVSVNELSTNSWIADLEMVSNLDSKRIASNNSQEQRNHEDRVNAEFTEKFKKYWTQDPICLQVSKDGDNIFFWIKENGTSYKPSQRSQGQQWYLSFYIRIVAKIQEDRPNVVLIDEPGLYLHAQAQKDLLAVLNDSIISANYPIVFSTHSPYLISRDNIEAVRLVEKTDRETTILGKVHAHSKADEETLTPILTAIGLGMNDSITNVEQQNNIVIEGPEDTFYLQAFKGALPKKRRPQLNFVSGGGSGNMGIVGAILEGWGCNVKYLLDCDKGGKDGISNLQDTWYVNKDVIFEVLPDIREATTADILSRADFQKYVLKDPRVKKQSKNSTLLKSCGCDKVLLARQFLQAVNHGDVTLDSTSIENIEQLFSKLT